MHLIQDLPSQTQITQKDPLHIQIGDRCFELPLVIHNDQVATFDIQNIESFFDKTDFSKYEIVLLGVGDGIQTSYWSQFQKTCFLQNCGFEWLCLSDAISMLQVLLDEKRQFLAILSSDSIQ